MRAALLCRGCTVLHRLCGASYADATRLSVCVRVTHRVIRQGSSAPHRPTWRKQTVTGNPTNTEVTRCSQTPPSARKEKIGANTNGTKVTAAQPAPDRVPRNALPVTGHHAIAEMMGLPQHNFAPQQCALRHRHQHTYTQDSGAARAASGVPPHRLSQMPHHGFAPHQHRPCTVAGRCPSR